MNQTLEITTPSDLELQFARVFAAPLNLVWEVHTKGEHLARWQGPHTIKYSKYEVDCRPGGVWDSVCTDSDGNEQRFYGEIREVEPMTKLVLTFVWDGAPGHPLLNTVTFEPVEGGTRATYHSLFTDKGSRDGMVAYGMETGVKQGFEKLDALLASMGVVL